MVTADDNEATSEFLAACAGKAGLSLGAEHELIVGVGMVFEGLPAASDLDQPAGSHDLGIEFTWPGAAEPTVGPLRALHSHDLHVPWIGTGTGRRISQNRLKDWRCAIPSYGLSFPTEQPGREPDAEHDRDTDRGPSAYRRARTPSVAGRPRSPAEALFNTRPRK